ncbi:MAG: hypothetical protein WAW02_01190 [Sideroxyarcus sp.]
MDAAITKIALVTLAISGLGYIVLSPMYETGIWTIVVPVLGAVDLLIAYAVWKRRAWVNKWLLPIGIGTLLVAVPFWGESSEVYGALAVTMLGVESAEIIAAVCLIVLAFRPGFTRSHG